MHDINMTINNLNTIESQLSHIHHGVESGRDISGHLVELRMYTRDIIHELRKQKHEKENNNSGHRFLDNHGVAGGNIGTGNI